MDNQNTQEEKKQMSMRPWHFWFMLFFSIAAMGFIAYSYNKALEETHQKLESSQKENSTCSFKRDSLSKEVKELSIYKSLTKAMVHRDEATSLLNYKIGDLVYLKRDSSRVVIEDIVIGGSKYQYYIKYKVLFKDNSTQEVIPELIY